MWLWVERQKRTKSLLFAVWSLHFSPTSKENKKFISLEILWHSCHDSFLQRFITVMHISICCTRNVFNCHDSNVTMQNYATYSCFVFWILGWNGTRRVVYEVHLYKSDWYVFFCLFCCSSALWIILFMFRTENIDSSLLKKKITSSSTQNSMLPIKPPSQRHPETNLHVVLVFQL